jgi:predicted DNA-binding helix-hairpin-helix protein
MYRAKYPLAGLSRLLQVYGKGLAVGYDIGCAHSGTVRRSSLGTVAEAAHLQFYVGAFHRYAHNRRCQLGFHPRILTTAGLEDFETNEWIFSRQNFTASLFRFASKYHCHMTLHLFWDRWDRDRQAALG